MPEEAEKQLHCFAYRDNAGLLLIPLRNRKEVGITNIAGADVEVEEIRVTTNINIISGNNVSNNNGYDIQFCGYSSNIKSTSIFAQYLI
ncbi:MAG: hypothetical protein U9R10_01370 [Euryarchaeota archaeon]|nr:hypothetical protein [Euryarchaeota archaeon]